MTVLGSDNFARANQTAWGTASDSQTWAQVRGTATWAITSNEGTTNGNLGFFNVFALGSKTPADAELLVRVTPASAVASTYYGLVARCTSSSNFYYATIDNGTTAEIGKDVAGVFTVIASVSFTYTAATAYWLRFRLIGTGLFLRVWADGSAEPNTWTVTTTDSALTSGQFGVGIQNESASNTTVDSFYTVDYLNAETFPVSDSGGLYRWPVEVLTASDLSGNLFRWPVDATTVTETALYTDAEIPIEALTAADINGGALQSWPIDTNTVSDSGGLYRWPVDTLSASDSLLGTDSAIPVESIPASDTLLKTDTELSIDALTVSDLGGNLQRWPVDALTATDSLLGVDSTVLLDGLSGVEVDLAIDLYSRVESLSADDSASTMTSSSSGGITTTTFSFTEALVITDSFLGMDGTSVIEANSASDSLVALLSSGSTESLSASDSLLKLDGYIPLDALAAGDMGNGQRWPVDSLVASDTVIASDSYLPTEVQGIVESLLAGDSAGWVELLAAGDTAGMISAPVAPPVPGMKIVWVTRDMKTTWKTRDMKTSWKTRDERASWATRDEKAAWKTRDDKVTWKTRGG